MRLQNIRIAIAAVILTAISACQLFGITQPLSFDQKLATAYVSHTAIVTATTSAVNAHTITSAQAQKVLDLAVASRGILDQTKVLETTGNVAGANQELILATGSLTALQTYLNSLGAK